MTVKNASYAVKHYEVETQPDVPMGNEHREVHAFSMVRNPASRLIVRFAIDKPVKDDYHLTVLAPTSYDLRKCDLEDLRDLVNRTLDGWDE